MSLADARPLEPRALPLTPGARPLPVVAAPAPAVPADKVVAAHLALGVAGLLAFAAALAHGAAAARGPYYQPLFLGLVHLAVLGWLLPTAIGALYRLAPAFHGAPVLSPRLSWVALGLYASGAAGVTGHLWTFATGPGLPMSAALLAAGLILHVANLGGALARGRAEQPSGACMAAALLWLAATAALGLLLAWNLWRPFLSSDHTLLLKAHAHAGGLGFFGLLVIGVAPRLLEQFLVSKGAPRAAARVAFAATNASLVALFLGFILGEGRGPLVPLGAALALAGAVAFALQARAVHARRLDRRGGVAWRHTVAAIAWLLLAAAIGLALALDLPPAAWRPRLEVAYGTAALLGFVGSIILGQLYRILPTIVRSLRGGGPPSAEALATEPRLLQWTAAQAGLALLAAGLALDAPALRITGALAFALGAALFAADMGRALRRP